MDPGFHEFHPLPVYINFMETGGDIISIEPQQDFQQCRILTSIDSGEPVPYVYLRTGLSLCWPHIPHCWKSHVAALLPFFLLMIFCLFDLILYIQVNKFSVMSGPVFLG